MWHRTFGLWKLTGPNRNLPDRIKWTWIFLQPDVIYLTTTKRHFQDKIPLENCWHLLNEKWKFNLEIKKVKLKRWQKRCQKRCQNLSDSWSCNFEKLSDRQPFLSGIVRRTGVKSHSWLNKIYLKIYDRICWVEHDPTRIKPLIYFIILFLS